MLNIKSFYYDKQLEVFVVFFIGATHHAIFSLEEIVWCTDWDQKPPWFLQYDWESNERHPSKSKSN